MVLPHQRAGNGRVDVLLVCSPGGHLLQLYALSEAWSAFTRAWVTLDASDTRSLLRNESVHIAHGPTQRNVVNLCRNLWLAFGLLRASRPKAVVTTGAGLAVPFLWAARALGIRTVYVESLTRVTTPSLACRLVSSTADRVYVQWPALTEAIPSACYRGPIVASGQ
jgi:UDP-N-acetylglucosamine:LPS N-acetylglucosamine transferase